MINRILASKMGKDRIPYIAIKSLKLIFKAAIKQIIDLLYKGEQKLLKDYFQSSSNYSLFSDYLIFKAYETAKHLIEKHQDLSVYLSQYEKDKDVILNECPMKLEQLY